MTKFKLLGSNSSGVVLITVLVIITALTIIGVALLSQATSQFTLTSQDATTVNALYTAEAGVEQTIAQLNQNNSFTGYTSAQQFYDNASQGNGSFTTTITTSPENSSAKLITSIGNVYNFNNSSDLMSSRKVEVTVVGTASPGYSVESGPGGLILTGSASVTNSSLYLNGSLTMSGHSSIGTQSDPLTLYDANDSCPPGANPGNSYPQVCSSGHQPFSFSGNPVIYGSVCATGQTDSTYIKTGNGGQGLEAGCTAPVIGPSLPSTWRSTQIGAVTTTGSGSSNTYVCNNSPFNRNWPANLELTGNVSLGGSCNVDIKGNVYITGNLNLGGSSTIQVDNSLGTTQPVVLVDGTINVGGSSKILENSSGTGVEFISWDSNDAECNPGCTSITGTDLYNTQTFQTISVGGSAKVPGSIFYAYWGLVNLSGSGNVGSADGQTVELSGAGTVTFGTTLSSGTSTWTISSYQIKYPGG